MEKCLSHFMSTWNILCPLGIFYGHLVYLIEGWYIFWTFLILFSCFGILQLEKSGNPGLAATTRTHHRKLRTKRM
jgi:hypothetical protein